MTRECSDCFVTYGEKSAEPALRRGEVLFMRINFVITELYVGGAERCLTELALGLAEAGDQVSVFSIGAFPTGKQRLLVDRLQNAGIEIESADADSLLRAITAYKKLKTWFVRTRPDLCQTFMYHANVLGTLAAQASEVPICVGGLRVAEARPTRCRIERMAIQRMQSLVCVSEEVRQFAIERLSAFSDDTVVVPNSVDVTRFSTCQPVNWASIGWPDDVVVSLFVGRLHPQKGIDLLQRQIDAIAPQGSNRRLLLVGEGPLQNEIAKWARDVGEDRVKWLPWQENVAPLMRACRLLVLPSRYEGMPNVVMEAMAAGRPIVCSRVEGCRQLLGDRLEQQSFPSGDDGAMKNLVEQFLSDEMYASEIGQDNQSRVRNEFSLATMIDAYRSHYRSLLTRRLDVE